MLHCALLCQFAGLWYPVETLLEISRLVSRKYEEEINDITSHTSVVQLVQGQEVWTADILFSCK